jgi:uncharacterized DUF497 family protein
VLSMAFYLAELLWDGRAEDHIAGHGLTPEDVDDACFDPDRHGTVARSGTYRLIGRTEAGALLTVFLAPRPAALEGPGCFYPVTARRAADDEGRLYERHRRR